MWRRRIIVRCNTTCRLLDRKVTIPPSRPNPPSVPSSPTSLNVTGYKRNNSIFLGWSIWPLEPARKCQFQNWKYLAEAHNNSSADVCWQMFSGESRTSSASVQDLYLEVNGPAYHISTHHTDAQLGPEQMDQASLFRSRSFPGLVCDPCYVAQHLMRVRVHLASMGLSPCSQLHPSDGVLTAGRRKRKRTLALGTV